jgi:hypothetical protein
VSESGCKNAFALFFVHNIVIVACIPVTKDIPSESILAPEHVAELSLVPIPVRVSQCAVPRPHIIKPLPLIQIPIGLFLDSDELPFAVFPLPCVLHSSQALELPMSVGFVIIELAYVAVAAGEHIKPVSPDAQHEFPSELVSFLGRQNTAAMNLPEKHWSTVLPEF